MARKKWKGWAFRQHPFCHYCGRRLIMKPHGKPKHHPPNLATVDHMQPTTHGGRDETSNYALACWQCNHDKDDLSYETFLLIIANRTKNNLGDARTPLAIAETRKDKRPWMQNS